MNQRKIAVSDLVFAAAGLLAVLSTFLPWWKESISATVDGRMVGVGSITVDGWNVASSAGRREAAGETITGPVVWIPMLLLLIVGIIALVRALAAPQLLPGRLFGQAGLGVGALSVVLVVVRWVTYFALRRSYAPAGSVATVSTGADFGTFVGLLCALAAAGAGVWALLQTASAAASAGAAPYGGGFGQPQYGRAPRFGQPQQSYEPQPQAHPQQPQYGQPQQPYGPPQPAPQPAYGRQPQGHPQQPQQPYGQPQPPRQWQ